MKQMIFFFFKCLNWSYLCLSCTTKPRADEQSGCSVLVGRRAAGAAGAAGMVSLQQVLFYVGVTFPFSAVSKRPACCYEPVPVPHTSSHRPPSNTHLLGSSIQRLPYQISTLLLAFCPWVWRTVGSLILGGGGSTVVGTFSIKKHSVPEWSDFIRKLIIVCEVTAE